MNIREIDRKLAKVYEDMSETFGNFQKQTGLSCLAECGRCCVNPDIETSVLEMIPFALKVYDEGKIEEWLEMVQTDEQKICLLFAPRGQNGLGSCSSYQQRPSICRMFGVAATFNKHHQKTLSICKYIREDQPDLTDATIKEIPHDAPMIPVWFSQISAIDPDLARERFPINLAMQKALEKIAFLSQYGAIS